jgi:hypothetical protein
MCSTNAESGSAGDGGNLTMVHPSAASAVSYSWCCRLARWKSMGSRAMCVSSQRVMLAGMARVSASVIASRGEMRESAR